eukprot:TRINITY_DN4268_c0_g1_i3.p1 TRINITY_DN4268_c0_g1~~TRINITY_DN4268_c0_g1_i3.p1  ORF type:complete len:361 (-),score=72.99 TRINITY_DN4268_c0_g1_i3:286-1332(-)
MTACVDATDRPPRPPMTAWDVFTNRADDDVLSLAIGYLSAASVLSLAAASWSAAARLVGEPGASLSGGVQTAEQMDEEADCVSLVPPSVVHRFTAAQLVGGAQAARAAVAAASITSKQQSSKKHAAAAALGFDQLAGLRALVSASATADALRLAMVLTQADETYASLRPRSQSEGAGETTAELFLEAFFRSEVQLERNRASEIDCTVSEAAASAAFVALLSASEDAANILARGAADAIRRAERNLDDMVDEGRLASHPHSYEPIARKRSAVEFLRGRFKSESAPLSAECAEDLNSSVVALDETIKDYMTEGYMFSCPKLDGSRFGKPLVPYTHWWARRGAGLAVGFSD